jgi:hypothetical protein
MCSAPPIGKPGSGNGADAIFRGSEEIRWSIGSGNGVGDTSGLTPAKCDDLSEKEKQTFGDCDGRTRKKPMRIVGYVIE